MPAQDALDTVPMRRRVVETATDFDDFFALASMEARRSAASFARISALVDPDADGPPPASPRA